MQIGDKVRYFGSLTQLHGEYLLIEIGHRESPPDRNGVKTTRGYVLEGENGYRLTHVSSRSIALV